MLDMKVRGKEGEDIALKILENKDYQIIERNYQIGKIGELDFVAEDPNGDLVFVEVKYRGTDAYGDPEYAITKSKQKQLKKLATIYLYEKDIVDQTCRFDVVTIRHLPGEEAEINHYIDAFR